MQLNKKTFTHMRKVQIQAKYLVIDVETSGVKAWENGLIQLGAIALDSELEIVDTFNSYVIPPKDTIWDKESEEVHKITKKFLAENGVDYKEAVSNFLNFIKDNFRDKPILIGQFLPFDYSFLDRVFEYAFPNTGLFKNVLSRNFIDTKSLASVFNLKSDLEGKPLIFLETSLSKPTGLVDSLGLNREDYKVHDALGDCYATRDVLVKLLELLDISTIELEHLSK